jgi:hypothetical protein
MMRRYEAAGVEVPTDVHISVGFKPGGGPESAKVMGCCYVRLASSGNVNEIFISPEWDNPADVLETLAHELIHAASDCQDGHGPGFKRDALAFGFLSPMTSTPASDELKLFLRMVAATLGPFPHSATRIMALKRRPKTDPVKPDGNASADGDGGKQHSGRPKQNTAMLKLECINPGCGFIARATAKNLDLGMPICACGTPLSSPQYAEALTERWWGNDPRYSGGRRPDYLIEAEVKSMDESLAKRREWSRARGFLPAVATAVATAATAAVESVAKRVRKPVARKAPAAPVKTPAVKRDTTPAPVKRHPKAVRLYVEKAPEAQGEWYQVGARYGMRSQVHIINRFPTMGDAQAWVNEYDGLLYDASGFIKGDCLMHDVPLLTRTTRIDLATGEIVSDTSQTVSDPVMVYMGHKTPCDVIPSGKAPYATHNGVRVSIVRTSGHDIAGVEESHRDSVKAAREESARTAYAAAGSEYIARNPIPTRVQWMTRPADLTKPFPKPRNTRELFAPEPFGLGDWIEWEENGVTREGQVWGESTDRGYWWVATTGLNGARNHVSTMYYPKASARTAQTEPVIRRVEVKEPASKFGTVQRIVHDFPVRRKAAQAVQPELIAA